MPHRLKLREAKPKPNSKQNGIDALNTHCYEQLFKLRQSPCGLMNSPGICTQHEVFQLLQDVRFLRQS